MDYLKKHRKKIIPDEDKPKLITINLVDNINLASDKLARF